MKRAISGAAGLFALLVLTLVIWTMVTPKLKRSGAIEQLLPSVVREPIDAESVHRPLHVGIA